MGLFSRFAKKNTASTRSIIGNTTLFTTCFICVSAAFHVPSIAPATFPASANAATENALTITTASSEIIRIFIVFFIVKPPFS